MPMHDVHGVHCVPSTSTGNRIIKSNVIVWLGPNFILFIVRCKVISSFHFDFILFFVWTKQDNSFIRFTHSHARHTQIYLSTFSKEYVMPCICMHAKKSFRLGYEMCHWSLRITDTTESLLFCRLPIAVCQHNENRTTTKNEMKIGTQKANTKTIDVAHSFARTWKRRMPATVTATGNTTILWRLNEFRSAAQLKAIEMSHICNVTVQIEWQRKWQSPQISD